MVTSDGIYDGMKNPLTKNEWLELMNDHEIFTDSRMDVIRCFIEYGGEAAPVQLEDAFGDDYHHYKTNIELLGKDVCEAKHLPNGGENSQWWYVLAKGRFTKPDERGHYVWILRDELIEAYKEYTDYSEIKPDDGDSELGIGLGDREGARKEYVSVRYERSKSNRERAIKKYGCKCQVCGFDFGKAYGPLGEGFIEVHHIKFLKDTGETDINPEEDLICLCSNCHRMIHRSQEYLTPEKLKKIYDANRVRQS